MPPVPEIFLPSTSISLRGLNRAGMPKREMADAAMWQILSRYDRIAAVEGFLTRHAVQLPAEGRLLE